MTKTRETEFRGTTPSPRNKAPCRPMPPSPGTARIFKRAKVVKLRNTIDLVPMDRAHGDYAPQDEYLRRVHAVRKKLRTRTRWAKDFQRRLLSQLGRIGTANGFVSVQPPITFNTLPKAASFEE